MPPLRRLRVRVSDIPHPVITLKLLDVAMVSLPLHNYCCEQVALPHVFLAHGKPAALSG